MVAQRMMELQVLELAGCLFPTSHLPLLARLPALHTLHLDVGCWWSNDAANPYAHALQPTRAAVAAAGTGHALATCPVLAPTPGGDNSFLENDTPGVLFALCGESQSLTKVELVVSGRGYGNRKLLAAERQQAVEAVCEATRTALAAAGRGVPGLALRANDKDTLTHLMGKELDYMWWH